MLLWIILIALFAYLFYTRIWVVYSKINYYRKQGVPFHSRIYPIVGSYITMMEAAKKEDCRSSIVAQLIDDEYCQDKNVPAICGIVLGTQVSLIVNRPEPCEDLLVTKNKYFDKHPYSAEMLMRLTGNSILFAKSDIKWQQKRKALSAALYKEKLRAMIEMMKNVTIETIQNNWMKADKKEIDIVKETSNLFIKITLECLFGEDKGDIVVPQRNDGKMSKKLLGQTIVSLIEEITRRLFQPLTILFPELLPFYITSKDKDMAFNQDQVRNLISDMILERREAIKKDSSLNNKGDLLTIMLNDPLYENNDQQIIDESMTFFLAGTLTQANTISNVICYLIQLPEIDKRVRVCMAKNFKSFQDPKASLEDLSNELTIDSLDLGADDYLKYVINETLRIDPPIQFSSSFCVTEDLDIAGIKIKANDMIMTNIYKLHHLEDQWGVDHNEFKPERFIGRGKHNPLSFMPFLAGKRVCVGKTFAENSIKVVLPLILKAFPKLAFVNPAYYKSRPVNNSSAVKRPEIKISW